jgi:transposase
MRINYAAAITEDEPALAALERQLRGRRTAVRVRLLRLLKSGQVPSMQAAAPLLGYSLRQLQTWWRWYRQGGLARLIAERPRPGKVSRLTEEAYRALEAEMTAGRIATLKDAQTYLRQRWGIAYHSLNGVWRQLHRRRARPKTGRRRHVKADPAAQAAYRDGF